MPNILYETRKNHHQEFVKNHRTPKKALLSQHQDHSALLRIMRDVGEKTHLTVEDMENVMKTFKKSSHDGTINGVLGQKEFNEAIKSFGLDKVIADSLFAACDMDGNKLINFKEFMVGMSIFIAGKFEEKAKFLFNMLDIDKSGFLDPIEVRRILKIILSLSEEQPVVEGKVYSRIESIMRTLDKNGDSKITLKEFIDSFQKSPYLIQAFHYLFGHTMVPQVDINKMLSTRL